MLELNTFSIAARCKRTGRLGVAVATAVPAVGALCPHVRAGVGAICTQSWTNPYLGIDGLGLLADGRSAAEALEVVLAGDPGRASRQVGIVDHHGASAAWSGEECTPWFGHHSGTDFAVQGNMLMGEATLNAMTDTFACTEPLDLPERLLLVLEAAQAAGGDKRGHQSAAVKVVHQEEYPYLDLRVDEHHHPVAELRRVFEIARRQYLPFIVGMPTRSNPLGNLSDETRAMLLTPPPDRPGGGGSA